MKSKLFLFTLIIFGIYSCKQPEKTFEIVSFNSSLYKTYNLSDSILLRKIVTPNLLLDTNVYLVLQFEIKYMESDGFFYSHSGTIEPGINGSKDSILDITFSQYNDDRLNENLISPSLENRSIYMQDSNDIFVQQSSYDYNSIKEFIKCYNKKEIKCKGVKIKYPLIFKISNVRNFYSSARNPNFYIRIIFSNNRILEAPISLP